MSGQMRSETPRSVTQLTVEYHGDAFVVVHDTRTGLRVASRDFETARALVLEGNALMAQEGVFVETPPRSSASWRPRVNLPSMLKYFVLIAPIVLVAVLLVMTVRQTLHVIPKLVPSSTDVFRTLRVGTLKVDAALHDIEPRNREELLVAIRSIVSALKPYADEIKPLFNDDKRDQKAVGEPTGIPARMEPK